MEPNRANRLWWMAGVLGAVTVALWWQLRPGPGSPRAPQPAADSRSTNHLSAVSSNTAIFSSSLKRSFEEVARTLTQPGAGLPRAEGLARLRQALEATSTNQAVLEIRRFLGSKANVSTGLGFKVGGQGLLAEAPTLRTYLLDYLGRIDPVAAAEYAWVILSAKDSPDEWAVAMRNLARGDTSVAGRELLEQKTGELLQHKPWQENPSVGYLESFDVAVYLGGTKLVPLLGDLLRPQDNPAVAHAAYLSLDRLVIANPDAVLRTLLENPELMAGREQTRGDYFARADVRDPRQRESVEAYLLDPKRAGAELQQFAGVFPNANYMVSQNLLTPVTTPDSTGISSRDAASLAVVEEWLVDPRFTKVRPQLDRMKSRLAEFVRQAQRGSSPPPQN